MALDPDAVAAAAAACPSVAGLASGAMGEVATYLPGRRVAGVRAGPQALEVHVVAKWDSPLPEVGEQVRKAVSPLAEGRPVEVFIDDIEGPAESP